MDSRKKRKTHTRHCSQCRTRHGKLTGQKCKKTRKVQESLNELRDSSEDEGTVVIGKMTALNQDVVMAKLVEENRRLQAELEGISKDGDHSTLIKENERLQTELNESKSREASAKDPSTEDTSEGGKVNVESKDKVAEGLEKLATAMQTLTTKMSTLDSEMKLLATKVDQKNTTATEKVPGENEDGEDLDSRISAILGNDGTKQKSSTTQVVTRNTLHAIYSEDDDMKKLGKLIKSGRELRAEHHLVRTVPWPHERVFRLPDIKGVPYDTMTINEFTYGYVVQANEPRNASIRERMMEHFEFLMEDSKDFPTDWATIRAFHALVLTYIEKGLLNWEDTMKITLLRQKYVFAMKGSSRQTYPCQDYNMGTCRVRRDHDGYNHSCAYCFATTGRHLQHPQSACYKLHGPPRGGREIARQGQYDRRQGPW